MVEKTEYLAALVVTGTWQGTKMYEKLGWESLSDRWMCKRVLNLHKIIDEKIPDYW